MTRASLLQIIDHVSVISDSEIRELEQLAAAFPYCQTAHVLLAKAAHDQGSMLASQRLRRAATYAADRQLLRQLIEEPAPALASAAGFEPVAFAQPPLTAESEAENPATTAFPEVADLAEAEEATPLLVPAEPEIEPEVAPATEPDFAATESADAPVADAQPLEAAEAEPTETAPVETLEAEPAEHFAGPLADEPQATEATADSESLAPVTAADSAPEEAAAENTLTAASEPAETESATSESDPTAEEPAITEAGQMLVEAPEQLAEGTEEDAAEPEAAGQEAEAPLEPVAASIAEDQEVITELPTSADESKTPGSEVAEADSTLEDSDILPPVAPPIRPPVEVGSSRFEFGLGLPEPGGPGAYELPTLEEEEAESVVEPAAVAGFRGDEHVGYALGGGSRLGFCLQLADGLTQPLPATEFFAPDALLHAQTPHYLPPPPPAPSPFDLINKFLRNQPRLRAPAVLPVSAEEQADLSVRSTQGVPDIASESLAKIMVRQGKLQKAIEIYERLIVRQPEKKAYFAEQIQQLKSTE